jgi:tetratricopeptide (TPR) repeat protein
MRNNFKILLFFLLFQVKQLLGQEKCKCSALSNIEVELNSALESQEESLFSELICAVDLSIPTCRQSFYYWKSNYFNKTNKLDSFEFYLNLFHRQIPKHPCDYNILKFNYLNGYFLVKSEKYDSASYYFLKTIDQAKKMNDNHFLAKSNLGMGLVFDRIMQPFKAIPYYKNGIILSKQLKDDKILLIGLANLQSSFGMCYDETNENKYLDSVKYYCLKTLKLAQTLNSKKEIIRTYVTLAGAYISDKSYKQALYYCDKVIGMADKDKNKSQLHSAYFKKAQCFIEIKEYKKAIKAADLSLFFADNNAKKANATYRLYEANKLLGNFEKALLYHEELKTLDEEVWSKDRLQTVTELEQKYEKSKNEKTIKELNLDSEIKSLRIKVLLFAIVIAIFIIFIVFIVFNQKNLKSKQKIIEIEQRLNRSRINPHFFFNALTTLQGLAIKENDGKNIALNLFKFSSLMRKTLESSYNDFVTVEDELNFINQYIELQQLRQKDKFEFRVDISDEIEISHVLIPSMIIQPFIENAIEHGFSSIANGGKIQLKFSIDPTNLLVTICDNGLGIRDTFQEKNNHISRAIQITKDRIFLINKEKKSNSGFTIKNRIPNGVEILLVLPLKYRDESISN